DALRVHTLVLDEVAGAVHLVAEVLAAHVAVDGGAPVAAVAGGAAVVDVQHGEAAGREHVVEHVLAVVAGPALVHVVQVAGAVDEDDGAAVRLRAEVARPVDAGRDLHAVARVEPDDVRVDPAERAPLLGGRGGDAAQLGAGAVVRDVQLGRPVRV